MKTAQIDVDLIAKFEDVQLGGGFERLLPDFMRQMRYTANQRAFDVGGAVRTTAQPELVVKEGQSPFQGFVFMLSTRWIVDVPDDAEIPTER